jgi:hypothetical protein
VFLNTFWATTRFVVFAAIFHLGEQGLQVNVGVFSHGSPRAV